MYQLTKRFITLIEIMIVMILIAMITAVIAINYQGSLDEGRAFQTRTGIDKIETILTLKLANEPTAIDDIEQNWQTYVKQSPLVKDPDKMVRDGWGDLYSVKIEPQEDGTTKIVVDSKNLDAYQNRQKS